MPELPEVETTRSGLAPVMTGTRIRKLELARPDLRFQFPDKFAERCRNRRIEALHRRAKYLLMELDSSETLLCHLGMSGSFLLLDADHQASLPPARHDHVIFHLSNGWQARYNDPRRFGFMTLFDSDDPASCRFIADLGPEPLGNGFSPRHLLTGCARRKGPVKTALLDQKLVAGLGNIYVCEALFRAGIHPARRACDLTEAEFETLVPHIRAILNEAIKAGGSTLQDFQNADGASGYFQHRFDVYDREKEPCRQTSCKGVIARMKQAGRSSFYCPACQPA